MLVIFYAQMQSNQVMREITENNFDCTCLRPYSSFVAALALLELVLHMDTLVLTYQSDVTIDDAVTHYLLFLQLSQQCPQMPSWTFCTEAKS